MTEYYKASCGCGFFLYNDEKKDLGDGIPSIEIDFYNINDRCPIGYELLSTGKTVGVFQLEKSLGQGWSKRLKPIDIEEISHLISIIRPGTLKSKMENSSGKMVSMTQHFVDRKHYMEEYEPIDESIRDITEPTYSIIVYQEQAMKIAVAVAGFTPQQADSLRKAMGKKDAALMSKVRIEFIEGCKKVGLITDDKANEIFDIIEKSNRYSFNKCLAYNEKIKRASQGKFKFDLTIEEMYKIRNDISYAKSTGHLSLYKKWKLRKNYGKGLSLCEDGRIRPNVIKDIQPAGVRNVFLITLENGLSIRTTSNHKFPTSHGELTIEQIVTSDDEIELFICGEYENSDFKTLNRFSSMNVNKIQSRSTGTVNGSFGESNYGYTNGSYSEFIKNDKIIAEICNICNKDNCRLELHHINGDRTNSSISNLERLCVSCHKKVEYANGRVKRGEKGYPKLTSKIISIINNGQCETYDVTMEGPNHNFVVENGIITCNSHGVTYGTVTYWSAYAKAHFPHLFFTAYLANSENKADSKEEVNTLVNDGKSFGMKFKSPSILNPHENFEVSNKTIEFGLGNIAKVGDKKVIEIQEAIKSIETELNKKFQDLSWFEILIHFSTKINSEVMKNLITVGAFRHLNMYRRYMLFELIKFEILTDREITAIKNSSSTSLADGIQYLLNGATSIKIIAKRREKLSDALETLLNPPNELKDNEDWISNAEKQILGVELTCSRLDTCNTSSSNCKCSEFNDSSMKEFRIAGTINKVSEYRPKEGKLQGLTMAYITITDNTGSCDAVIFPDKYKELDFLLFDGNTVCVIGRKTSSGSLQINNVIQL